MLLKDHYFEVGSLHNAVVPFPVLFFVVVVCFFFFEAE